jgi:DNA mismatch endonuclease, patch repair protein
MTDFLTKRARSRRMARIRGQDTGPEKVLRKELHKLGLRFRKNVAGMEGTPDILLPRHRTAIFVHGCFWHRHEGCRIASTPRSNVRFWREKFERNIARDKRKSRRLRSLGWRVFTVWECRLTTTDKAARTAATIARRLRLPCEPRKIAD